MSTSSPTTEHRLGGGYLAVVDVTGRANLFGPGGEFIETVAGLDAARAWAAEQEQDEVVSSWEAPSWATAVRQLDDRIEFWAPVGDGVHLVQVDELDPATHGVRLVSVKRLPAEIVVHGQRLSPAGARALVELLGIALDVVA